MATGGVGLPALFNNNYAIGANTDPEGDDNTIVGANNIVEGSRNVVVGHGNEVYGNNNVVIGCGCTVYGDNNVIIGSIVHKGNDYYYIENKPASKLRVPIANHDLLRMMAFMHVNLCSDVKSDVIRKLYHVQAVQETALTVVAEQLRANISAQ